MTLLSKGFGEVEDEERKKSKQDAKQQRKGES